MENNLEPASQGIYRGTYRIPPLFTGIKTRYFTALCFGRIQPCPPRQYFERFLRIGDVTRLNTRTSGQLQEKVVSTMQYRIENLVTFKKPLYTVPETADMLSLSRTTVYELIKAGKIKAVYPTSKARIPATSIVTFVKKQEEDARLDAQSMEHNP